MFVQFYVYIGKIECNDVTVRRNLHVYAFIQICNREVVGSSATRGALFSRKF